MSESAAQALTDINAKIDTLSSDVAAAATAISAEIAALKAQIAAGGTVDPTTTLAKLDTIDAAVKALVPAAPPAV